MNIITFTAKYLRISRGEALLHLINKYNIEIPDDIEETTYKSTMDVDYNSNIHSDKKEVTYKIEPVEEKTDKIVAMFDTVSYTSKPDGIETSYIKNRIPTLESKEYSLKEVKTMITSNKTCIPSGIKSEKDWIDNVNNLQIFEVDIDNKTKINRRNG